MGVGNSLPLCHVAQLLQRFTVDNQNGSYDGLHVEVGILGTSARSLSYSEGPLILHQANVKVTNLKLQLKQQIHSEKIKKI
jgi:hypothetical protein